jgi:hypothetical protein
MNEIAIEWLYCNNQSNKVRYVLGEKGDKMVACIGINPSTAKPDDLDNTLKSVKRISEYNGYDGWIMYNIYPQRATYPDELDTEINNNLRIKNSQVIRQSIIDLRINIIWLAWGNSIGIRNYLAFCLSDLYLNLIDLKLIWKIIENPTLKGHPRHPLYKKSENELLDFDIEKYIAEIINPKSSIEF